MVEDDVEYCWTNAAEDYYCDDGGAVETVDDFVHYYGDDDNFSKMPLDIKSITLVPML